MVKFLPLRASIEWLKKAAKDRHEANPSSKLHEAQLAIAGEYGFSSWRALVRVSVKTDLFAAAGIGDLDAVESFFDESGTLQSNASRTGSSRCAADSSRLPCPPPSKAEQISDALYIACRNGHEAVVRFL